MLSACSPKQDREFEAAKNSAAGSLSLRPHSRKELEVKLKDKGYSASAIVKALDRLKELVHPHRYLAQHCMTLYLLTVSCKAFSVLYAVHCVQQLSTQLPRP